MLHQIGVGALGPVFRTYEPERDRLVAVKAFRIDLTPEQARALADELSRVAESGLFHPSIVEPISAGVEGSVAYSAEEYVAAESLDVAMRHYAPAAVDTMLPFITQLAGAIDFARAAGVGHGALHPRDVFITPDEARVTGFGVVEALERVGFRAPVRRPYSPPERIAGDRWSTAADVFSLAAITYELLTARRPSGTGGEIGSLLPGAADHSAAALHDVLAQAMDEDPSRRFSSALAFASALEAAAHGRGAAAAAGVIAAQPQPAASVTTEAAAVTAAAGAAMTPGPDVPSTSEPHDKRPLDLDRDEPEAAEEVEADDDVAIERDEDEAHHQLTLRELNEAAEREELERVHAVEMDEDSEAEAEADRYAGDDFLLDAAGAASTPELPSHDDFRPAAASVAAGRAFGDDHPTRSSDADDLRNRHETDRAGRAAAASPPAAVAASQSFGGYRPEREHTAESTASRLPLLLTLILGLLVGLIGGYAVWGRSTPPPAAVQGREFSEQAVAPPRADPAAGSNKPAQPPAAAATSGSAPKPAAPPPVTPERTATPERSAASGAAAARGSTPARPATGTIVIRSTPTGAGVTVNGRWRGRTPIAVEGLPLARYDVRVVQPGFAPARQSVTLSASDPDGTVSVRLQPEAKGAPAARPQAGRGAAGSTAYSGSVFVDSRPRGAKVFIDGKEVGSTPISVPDVRIGSHIVRLELPDYRIWTSTTTVSAGRQSRVTGSLDRIQ